MTPITSSPPCQPRQRCTEPTTPQAPPDSCSSCSTSCQPKPVISCDWTRFITWCLPQILICSCRTDLEHLQKKKRILKNAVISLNKPFAPMASLSTPHPTKRQLHQRLLSTDPQIKLISYQNHTQMPPLTPTLLRAKHFWIVLFFCKYFKTQFWL